MVSPEMAARTVKSIQHCGYFYFQQPRSITLDTDLPVNAAIQYNAARRSAVPRLEKIPKLHRMCLAFFSRVGRAAVWLRRGPSRRRPVPPGQSAAHSAPGGVTGTASRRRPVPVRSGDVTRRRPRRAAGSRHLGAPSRAAQRVACPTLCLVSTPLTD